MTGTSAQVGKKRVGEGDVYVSELREPLTHSPQDRTFFARLDAQLNKIDKFFKKKEGEYIARAGVLERQMLALINLEEDIARQGLDYSSPIPTDASLLLSGSEWSTTAHPDGEDTTDAMPLILENVEKSNVYAMQTFPMKPTGGAHRDADTEEDQGEVESGIQDYIDQVATSNLKQRRANFRGQTTIELAIPAYPRSGSVSLMAPGSKFPSPSGRSVRFSPVTPEDRDCQSVPPTPRSSALKNVSHNPEPDPERDDEIEVMILNQTDIENQKVGQIMTVKSRREFSHAKELLRLAFVEFYRCLRLLFNFRYFLRLPIRSAVGLGCPR